MLSGKALSASLTAGAEAVYIEDVFSTYLYTGNGSTQTITNGIDLSGEGGLVWVKGRSYAYNHILSDTERGVDKQLVTNTTDAEATTSGRITGFNSDGFSLGSNVAVNSNVAGREGFASWTFRKAAKFFDVVTWAGDSTNNRQISHNLGVTPGCIIIKIINGNNSWIVWHRSLPTYGGELNSTNEFLSAYYTNLLNGAPTSTTFTVSYNGYNTTNETGYTYVAYLFAHDAGGFGDAGDQNVISCGSYTGNGSATGPTITLGWEPQWIMIKNTTTADSGTGWRIFDNMRGIVTGGTDGVLFANSSNAEVYAEVLSLNATGFQLTAPGSGINNSGDTYIYIAIRRGPMKTPESGTSVFTPVAQTGDSNISVGFPTDFGLRYNRAGGATIAVDRLRGSNGLYTPLTDPESSASTVKFDQQNLMTYGLGAGASVATYQFQRAPGFFDVVCYTGTGSATTVSHNLGVAPELMIVKRRNSSTYGDWYVYNASQGATKYLLLNLTDGVSTNSGPWNNTAPTSSVFTVGADLSINSSATYVAYLFASVTGVSKVGSYTGTGTTLQVNCGFTSGARFVLIKRTNSTGGWYVWDSARGIVAGNDPYLLLNSDAAEVTNTDYVDTYSAGFEISSTAPSAINANGGTFIYLAIA